MVACAATRFRRLFSPLSTRARLADALVWQRRGRHRFRSATATAFAGSPWYQSRPGRTTVSPQWRASCCRGRADVTRTAGTACGCSVVHLDYFFAYIPINLESPVWWKSCFRRRMDHRADQSSREFLNSTSSSREIFFWSLRLKDYSSIVAFSVITLRLLDPSGADFRFRFWRSRKDFQV